MRELIRVFNEWLARGRVRQAATVICTGIFGLIALIALPQALSNSFAPDGFHALPLVTWLVQTFLLQLILLGLIIWAQKVQWKIAETRSARNGGSGSCRPARHVGQSMQ